MTSRESAMADVVPEQDFVESGVAIAPNEIGRAQWLTLTAALLGWMFDGLEMGIFPVAGRPALRELIGTGNEADIGRWFGFAVAVFLVGAAAGGLLFGWLGDRIGRV